MYGSIKVKHTYRFSITHHYRPPQKNYCIRALKLQKEGFWDCCESEIDCGPFISMWYLISFIQKCQTMSVHRSWLHGFNKLCSANLQINACRMPSRWHIAPRTHQDKCHIKINAAFRSQSVSKNISINEIWYSQELIYKI